jgi:hypothetical protein
MNINYTASLHNYLIIIEAHLNPRLYFQSLFLVLCPLTGKRLMPNIPRKTSLTTNLFLRMLPVYHFLLRSTSNLFLFTATRLDPLMFKTI